MLTAAMLGAIVQGCVLLGCGDSGPSGSSGSMTSDRSSQVGKVEDGAVVGIAAPSNLDDEAILVASGTDSSSASQAGGGERVTTEACVAQTRQSNLLPVKLAFAFDVSGSMGKGDYPYHDRGLKWDPVVAATQAFFADPSSTGVSASLTFFPDERDKCDVDSYSEPDVAFAELPTSVFSDAISAVTPNASDDWRGGTPTMFVLLGTIDYLERQMAAEPEADYAIVLVSDGMPQSCGGDADEIETVAAVAGQVADRIPTYVMGVANPVTAAEPDPPDSVSNLELIAQAGGTQQAFIIDTGDPEQTSAAFAQVINTIREDSLSCNIAIPAPPPGQSLDTNLVNVGTVSAGQQVPLGYSPDCSAENSWRFDDESAPRVIELCPDVCEWIQADQSVQLDVEFGCVRRLGGVGTAR